ncbi:MAG: hypothetical protein M3Q39_04770 [Actinomycetota bacterium]|nr:hypothetical protein [Actinomycetota bacterium]
MIEVKGRIERQDRGEDVVPSDLLLNACRATQRTWSKVSDVPVRFGLILVWNKLLDALPPPCPRLPSRSSASTATLPGARVTRDERNPFDLGNSPPPSAAADAVPQEVLLELADRLERNWCNERVPALDGHTPREAAADPTRRDELARLIASFPEIDPASGMIGLRPARLRGLLGLAVTMN